MNEFCKSIKVLYGAMVDNVCYAYIIARILVMF